MGEHTLRLVREADAPAIVDIYRPYVEETNISFEYVTPSPAEFARRIRDISGEYPYLVWEEDGAITAYAYAHRLMERPAYQWNAELSVYVRQGQLHRGIGTALYGALTEILLLQNIRNIYGIVTAANDTSIRFHLRQGFREAGLYRNVGYKNGAWLDVAWLEKQIGTYAPVPAPFLPFPQIDGEQVAAILRRWQNRLR